MGRAPIDNKIYSWIENEVLFFASGPWGAHTKAREDTTSTEQTSVSASATNWKEDSRQTIALLINYNFNTSCQTTLTERYGRNRIYVQIRLSGKSCNSGIYTWDNETSAAYSFFSSRDQYNLQPMEVQHARWSAAKQPLCKQAHGRISTNAAAHPEIGQEKGIIYLATYSKILCYLVFFF